MLSAWQAKAEEMARDDSSDADDGWGLGVGHRIAAGDVWRARGQAETGASEQCAVPHARAFVCCAQ